MLNILRASLPVLALTSACGGRGPDSEDLLEQKFIPGDVSYLQLDTLARMVAQSPISNDAKRNIIDAFKEFYNGDTENITVIPTNLKDGNVYVFHEESTPRGRRMFVPEGDLAPESAYHIVRLVYSHINRTDPYADYYYGMLAGVAVAKVANPASDLSELDNTRNYPLFSIAFFLDTYGLGCGKSDLFAFYMNQDRIVIDESMIDYYQKLITEGEEELKHEQSANGVTARSLELFNKISDWKKSVSFFADLRDKHLAESDHAPWTVMESAAMLTIASKYPPKQ